MSEDGGGCRRPARRGVSVCKRCQLARNLVQKPLIFVMITSDKETDFHDSFFASIAAISAIIVPPNDDNVASTPSILEFTSAIVTIKYLIQPQ